jgi:hypothetical protein
MSRLLGFRKTAGFACKGHIVPQRLEARKAPSDWAFKLLNAQPTPQHGNPKRKRRGQGRTTTKLRTPTVAGKHGSTRKQNDDGVSPRHT